jgi:4-amino-4-deoxy-L-arabinose transferase-like glycosyltransferase
MKRTDLAALVLALAGGAASFLAADRVFEQIPHLEDEFAYLWEAEVMAEGRVSLPSPDPPESFLVPFVVDYQGQRFGKYPPGWPATLSLGARFGALWLVNSVFASMSIWLTYRLASKVVSERLSLFAAVLTLLSPMFLLLSGSLLAHTFTLFLTLAFVLAWLDLFMDRDDQVSARIPHWLLTLVGGLSLGLLALTRPLTAVAVALPFIVHAVNLWIRGGVEIRKRLIAVGGLAVVIALLLPYWQAMLTGDPTRNLYTLWWEYDRVGFGPGIGVTESGHNIYLAYWNTKWSLKVGRHDLFGWPYLSWIFLPFGLFAMRKEVKSWLLFSLFPSMVLVYAFYWVGSWLYGPRYYFESLPILAIISAAGIVDVGGWLRDGAKFVRARRLAILALVLILVTGNLAFYLPARMEMMSGLYGISRSRIERFEELGIKSGLVIVHIIDNWREYGNLLPLTPPFSESGLIVVISRGEEVDEALAARLALPTYHYYLDDPGAILREPRG